MWSNILRTESELRAVYKPPAAGVVAKDIGQIDAHFRRFIELSPFLCMGTMGADGLGDVTPRGGEPGFVRVLDSKHLAMPDRPGNNRLDGLSNLLRQPGIGLVFFVPGFEDTLRVNGMAQIVTDLALKQRFLAEERLPLSVIVIEVKEIYLHCGKAVRRAGLWNQGVQIDRRSYPSAGQIYRDQLKLAREAAALDAMFEKDARDNLY
jgi:uncharacterized protein